MPTDVVVGEQSNNNAGDAINNVVVANTNDNSDHQLKSSPSSLSAAAPSATAVEHGAREPSSNLSNKESTSAIPTQRTMIMGEEDESLLDPKTAIQIASNMKDKSEREQVLLKALKAASRELNEAEIANKQANERVTAAREMYSLCAQLLSGYKPLETTRLSGKKRGLVESSVSVGAPPQDVDGGGNAYDEHCQQSTTVGMPKTEGGSVSLASPIKPEEDDDANIILPTNEVHLPEYYTEGGGMDATTVRQFRDNFYRRLTKNQADSTNIDTWVPPSGNANLKSKAQLQEWIYIATNWNTGTADLDAGSFRAKHKAFYARMKPVTSHLGRRTGMHLRQVEVQQQDGSKSMMTVFCRYNKAGDKSTVYVDVGRVRSCVLCSDYFYIFASACATYHVVLKLSVLFLSPSIHSCLMLCFKFTAWRATVERMHVRMLQIHDMLIFLIQY